MVIFSHCLDDIWANQKIIGQGHMFVCVRLVMPVNRISASFNLRVYTCISLNRNGPLDGARLKLWSLSYEGQVGLQLMIIFTIDE